MKYLVTVRLSVGPDVMLAYCTLKIYVPGGVGADGQPYHEDDGSFVLGCHPRRRDEVGAGLWVTRIQNMLRHTKGHRSGGPQLSERVFHSCPSVAV